ncbi:MAG TPA: VWA domain-containing protein, partial [Thermoanaerobaculia bacterium]
ITNFAEYRGRPDVAPDADPAAAPAVHDVPRQPRTIAIFLEKFALIPLRRDEFFDAVRNFVTDGMQSGDQAMLVTWDGRSLDVRQPMTNNRDDVLDTLEKVRGEFGPYLADSESNSRADAQDASDMLTFAAEGGAPDEGGQQMVAQNIVCPLMQLNAIKAKTRAITAILDTMAGVEGRKVMLMATRRFGATAGLDCFPTPEGMPQYVRSQYRTEPLRKQIIAAANANGVTVYPVYPASPGSVSPNASQRSEADPNIQFAANLFNETESLKHIARETGGATEYGPEIARLLPRINDDLDSYYSLAYRGQGGGADRVRNIDVRVKKPGLVVRARSEVVEKSDRTRMKDRVLAGLAFDVEPGRLGIAVQPGEVRKTGRNRYKLPVNVRIPIGQLTTLTEGKGERGAFTVVIAAGDGAVLYSDVTQKTQPFSIPASDLARARRSHYTYVAEVEIDAKVDRLVVGVFDEVGREYGVQRVDAGSRR